MRDAANAGGGSGSARNTKIKTENQSSYAGAPNPFTKIKHACGLMMIKIMNLGKKSMTKISWLKYTRLRTLVMKKMGTKDKDLSKKKIRLSIRSLNLLEKHSFILVKIFEQGCTSDSHVLHSGARYIWVAKWGYNCDLVCVYCKRKLASMLGCIRWVSFSNITGHSWFSGRVYGFTVEPINGRHAYIPFPSPLTMADALLSLAADLLNQLGSIAVQQAQQQINLIVGVDEEIQKFSDSFRIVQAMLNDAEKRQSTEAAVKLCNPAALKKKKVPCSFFPSLSCCFGQVDNLSLRYEIGHMIENLKQTLDNILRDEVMYGFDLTRHSHVEVERTPTTFFGDVSDMIGRDKYRDELLKNLLGEGSQEERNPRVISLVGMGGMGKSTLAQLAFNHPDIQAHFQQRIWVCVSDPFDQCKVAKAIIEYIEGQSPNITELQSLLPHICDLIGKKKFFLVLDDVWTEEFIKWEPFKNALKCGAQGSRILVTTRKINVAEMMESSHMINLEKLSSDDCWLMFSKIAFSNKDGI
uniref:Uncharacterized protein n=1 Tax=Quercus lobata TaxID=97700 RepID=A0A7N2LWA0_QUELO